MFHDESFSFLIFGIVGFLAGGWPIFYPFRMRLLSSNELEKISSTYKSIDVQYALFMVLWFIFVEALISSRLNDWAIASYGVRYYPLMVFGLGSLGAFQALLALWKGVYPQYKNINYVYGDEKKIRRVAMIQIVIAVIASILSVVAFNIIGTYFTVE